MQAEIAHHQIDAGGGEGQRLLVGGDPAPGRPAHLVGAEIGLDQGLDPTAPGQRGATMAVHSFIGFAGAFVGPLVFGVVLDLAGGRESLFAWGLAFASSGLVIALSPLVLATMGRRAGRDMGAT